LFHDETLIFRLIRALIFRVGQNDYNQMNDATRSHYIEVLERGHYRQIFGYPSALYLPVQRAWKRRAKSRMSPGGKPPCAIMRPNRWPRRHWPRKRAGSAWPKSSFALVISVAKSGDPSGVRSSKMTLKPGLSFNDFAPKAPLSVMSTNLLVQLPASS